MRREDSDWVQAGYTRDWWKAISPEKREAFLDELSEDEAESFFYDWRVWARTDQLIPDIKPDDSRWTIGLVCAGRGWGKTRCAVEWVLEEVDQGRAQRIAIVGQGEDDIRQVMITGESGFVSCAKPWNKPDFRPSVGGGQLLFPNGAIGYVYSAEDPESLRGPQFDLAWFDEPMACPADKREKTVSNLRFGLRLGSHPRLLYTTTPKKHRWMKKLLEDAANPKKKILLIRGSTLENDALPENFFESIMDDYDGTRLGRQEIYGELLTDEEGALWTDDLLSRQRLRCTETDDGSWPTQLLVAFANSCDEVVVGVDPNIKTGGTAHAAGIIVMGKKGRDLYVIADRSTKGGPEKWSVEAAKVAEEFGASIIAEANQGGEMVRMVVQQAATDLGTTVRVAIRTTQHGKQRRAEAVATAMERGHVFHLGTSKEFAKLEDQMCAIHDGTDPTGEDFDRMDAMVWAAKRLGVKLKTNRMSAAAGGIYTAEGLGIDGGRSRDTAERAPWG